MSIVKSDATVDNVVLVGLNVSFIDRHECQTESIHECVANTANYNTGLHISVVMKLCSLVLPYCHSQ